MTEPREKAAQTTAPPEGDKRFAPMIAVAGLVVGAAGFALRRLSGTYDAQVKDLVLRMARDRSPAGVALGAEKASVESIADLTRGIGTSLVPIGATLVIVALAVMAGSRLRIASALLGFPLLFSAIFCVYVVGIESLIFTSFAGFGLIAFVASEPDPRLKRTVEDARLMPTRLPRGDGPTADAYAAGVAAARDAAVKKRLTEVTALPAHVARPLSQVGVGKPAGFFKLKDGAAYLAFVETDALTLEEFVSVVMILEQPAPRFVARPLPIVEGRPVPNTGVQFKKDPDFAQIYLVEAAAGQSAKAVRSFLNPLVRDALYELDGVWLQVEGTTATATLFGAFDPDRVDRLVELSDVIFAEYGVGGESLLEPDDVQVDGVTKRPKKKKKKKSSASASGEAAPPA